MPTTRDDLHALALRAEAEHRVTAQARHQTCVDELERRRRELADEASRLLRRARLAARVA
jgi:hypothetical protein